MHNDAQHRLEYWVTEQLLENFSLPSFQNTADDRIDPSSSHLGKIFPQEVPVPNSSGKDSFLASPNFKFFNNKISSQGVKLEWANLRRKYILHFGLHLIKFYLSVLHHLISCIPHRRFSRDRCCEYLACWPVRRSDFLVQHSVQINSLIVHELF